MSTNIRLLCIFVLSGSLLGCGGGGTSDGAAGGGAGFNAAIDITPYIGEWSGQVNGPNAANVYEDRFIIGQYGGVIEPDPNPACPSGVAGKIIDSNPFNWVATYQCLIPGAGSCTVTENGTMQLNGTSITGDYKQVARCGASALPFTFVGDFFYLKQS